MGASADTALATVHRYHDGTKHHFERFARSLGYLDWASQPRPFRSFDGAPVFPLHPAPGAPASAYSPPSPAYGEIFAGHRAAAPFDAAAIGDLLRHSLGLSAWKEFRGSRWSLRVNPSSGNLHPTEAYVICGPMEGLAAAPAVYHYAADRHSLEQRCAFDDRDWSGARAADDDAVFVALTSIYWREAWKYGERAFRYCQHDLGHAIAAVAIAAAMLGWRAALLDWPHRTIAALTGIDRHDDFADAEREDAGCILALCRRGGAEPDRTGAGPARVGADSLMAAVRAGRWTGRATQLSEDHVQWTFIDEIARATEHPGRPVDDGPAAAAGAGVAGSPPRATSAGGERDARAIILQRRSAVAFDGRTTIDRTAFFAMLSRVRPAAHAPWDAVWWTPRVHLAIFVHRVIGLEPGVYLLARDARALPAWRAACGREFLWEAAHDDLPFVRLARGDCRRLAQRLSCDQDIAADGFFSLGMIAEFDGSLDAHGPSFYRHLFWETGVVGQVLYLEAEAAGARATGIGCFYDDPVHEALGLQGHAFQSLYHFTVGAPVEDGRLTTEPGYAWEIGPS